MELNANDYTAKRLREWLAHLGKPTWGNKATLIVRLNELPADERGTCPVEDDIHEDDIEVEEILYGSNDEDIELEAVKCELDNIRRERDLLKRENALLHQVANKKGANKNAEKENVVGASFTLLKEIMPEYNGEVDATMWVAQFKNIGKNYNADDSAMRALFASKLKGKAQNWLHTMPDYTSKDISELLNELSDQFQFKANKIKERQKFENRKWSHEEAFVHYCSEKTSLAGPLNIQEDELLEYIIDGIPDPHLRNQANLLCVSSKAHLIRAFSKIELKRPNYARDDKTKLHCLNCNATGHLTKDCRKSKREPGSCYGCGSMEHFIGQCPQNKNTVMTMSAENYNDYVSLF